MVLGEPVNLRKDFNPEVVAPVQIVNPWVTAIDAGGLDNLDGAPIVDVDAEITELTSKILDLKNNGTTLRCRVKYDRAATTVTTDLIIQVFAHYDFDEEWQKLVNKAGDHVVTMTIAEATDIDDGTAFQYTDVDPSAHAWDLDGCQQIIIGVNQILATNGDDTIALLQAKVI